MSKKKKEQKQEQKQEFYGVRDRERSGVYTNPDDFLNIDGEVFKGEYEAFETRFDAEMFAYSQPIFTFDMPFRKPKEKQAIKSEQADMSVAICCKFDDYLSTGAMAIVIENNKTYLQGEVLYPEEHRRLYAKKYNTEKEFYDYSEFDALDFVMNYCKEAISINSVDIYYTYYDDSIWSFITEWLKEELWRHCREHYLYTRKPMYINFHAICEPSAKKLADTVHNLANLTIYLDIKPNYSSRKDTI